MSFCANPRGECTPGPFNGNPIQGLCEKACIEVKKVLDAGLTQREVTQVPVAMVNPLPPNPPLPLIFISAASSSSKGQVSLLSVTPISGADRRARIRCNVGIPLKIVYADAGGAEGLADGTLTTAIDCVLCLPEASIIPYEIEAVVSAIASAGIIKGTTAILDCCVTIILKIVIETELLVPSYGYCRIPPLQEYASETCAGFFELPLYPS